MAAAPIDLVQRPDRRRPRRVLQRRRDRVLQVEEYGVGRAARRLLEEALRGGGHGEFGAMQTERAGRHVPATCHGAGSNGITAR